MRYLLLLAISTITVFVSCVDDPQAPEGKVVALFSHNGLNASCIKCHEKNRPIRDHEETMDCVSCHKSTDGWTQKISYAHPGPPNECISCHTGKRPTQAPHDQTRGCVECHSVTSWEKNIFYAHNPLSANCRECHEHQRPSDTLYPPPKNDLQEHHYNAKDCFGCHKSDTPGVSKNHQKVAWGFDHSNAEDKNIEFCLGCHKKAGKKKHIVTPWWFKGDGNCFKCHPERMSFEYTKEKYKEKE